MQRFRTTAHARPNSQQQQQQGQQQNEEAATQKQTQQTAAAGPTPVEPTRPLSYSAALFKSLDAHPPAAAAASAHSHTPLSMSHAHSSANSSAAPPPVLPRTPSARSRNLSSTPPSPADASSCSLLHVSDSVGEGFYHSSHSRACEDSPSHSRAGSRASSARSTPRASMSLGSSAASAEEHSYSSSLSPATASASLVREHKAHDNGSPHSDEQRKGHTSSVSSAQARNLSKDAASKQTASSNQHVAPPIADAQLFPTLGGAAAAVPAPAVKGTYPMSPAKI